MEMNTCTQLVFGTETLCLIITKNHIMQHEKASADHNPA